MEAALPRNGSGVYSKPAGTTAVAGTAIESAKYNSVIDDLATDANTPRPIVSGGTGASTVLAAQAALGLAIGTNVQAYDADLTAIAALTSAADKVPYATGAGTWALADFTAAGRALVDDADAAAQRGTLGLGDAILKDTLAVTDWNDVDDSGFYSSDNTATNAPAAQFLTGWASRYGTGGSGSGLVIAGHILGSDALYYRRKGSGTWQSWVQLIDTGNLKTNLNASGSAPIYAARAWANFNGTGTIALRASGNVSSLTDGGNGTYTVNLTTALADTNYAVIATVGTGSGNLAVQAQPSTTSAVSVRTYAVGTGTDTDAAQVQVVIYR